MRVISFVQQRFVALLVFFLLIGTLFIFPAFTTVNAASSQVWINEFHYDNTGSDTGEFIEVAGSAGTDLTGWSIVLYNGNGGGTYATYNLSGTLTDQCNGFGFSSINPSSIQNGGPDGFALVDDTNTVVQFLSYEGSFAATNGPASGMTSTDVGVNEPYNTPIGNSLQLTGNGTQYSDFTWAAASANTQDAINTGQTCGDSGSNSAWINEFHYDNTGADSGEFIEIAGNAGIDLTDWSIVLYNGNGGGSYGTYTLSGVLTDQCNGFGFSSINPSSIQNGAPDGFALVDDTNTVIQFLSYEGSFTAGEGPAAGMTSTDIGVYEASGTPVGNSLQLNGNGSQYDDFTWAAASANTQDAINTDQFFNGDNCPPPVFTIPYTNDFSSTFEGWSIYSVDSDTSHTWSWNSYFGNVDVNGYGDSTPANDWLISPAFDFDIPGDKTLSFSNYTRYSDSGQPYPQLKVLYSTDYSGTGDPTAATWTELSFNASPAGSSSWVNSGDIDVSGISGVAYIAFQYQSSGTGGGSSSNWRVDDFSLQAIVPIHIIQGSDTSTPLFGATVTIEGIVVGDFQDDLGTHGDLNGFYVQEEDADADGDPTTSEGIFVYQGSNPSFDIAEGDLVRITGTAGEFGGQTQISASAIEVISNENALPGSTVITLPLSSPSDLEAVEGMRIHFNQTMIATDLYTFGRFGEIGVTADGLWNGPDGRIETFTQLNAPDVTGFSQYLNSYNNSLIVLDDGFSAQNPASLPYPLGGLSSTNTFRAGDKFTSLSGVMGEGFGLYRVQPAADIASYGYIRVNPRPATPASVGGNITVAGANLLNWFATVDPGPDICGPAANLDCRGADDQGEQDRQLAKLTSEIVGLNSDVVGVVEIENSNNDAALQMLVDSVNLYGGAGSYDYVVTGATGTDAIRVGLIYRYNVVQALGTPAVLDTPAFTDPNSTGLQRNRPAIAQTFRVIDSMNPDYGAEFTVVVLHLKSKGTSGANTFCNIDPFNPDCDLGDGQGYWNDTRTKAMLELASWLETNPTGYQDSDVLIVGDYNGYYMEDPVQALPSYGGFTLLNTAYDYSYSFDGAWGALDHATASNSLALQVTGIADWHNNADEPLNFDYQNFNEGTPFFAPDAYRASDHDPVVIGLDLNRAPKAQFILAHEPPFLEGETVDFIFSTIDDEGGALTFELDCTNDGSFDVTSNSPTVSCHYPDAGSYTVLGRITDSFGDYSEYTLSFDVITTVDAITYLSNRVDDYQDDGVLNGGQANALGHKIDNLLRSLDRLDRDAALDQIQGIIDQLQGFMNSGKDVGELYYFAQRILIAISINY